MGQRFNRDRTKKTPTNPELRDVFTLLNPSEPLENRNISAILGAVRRLSRSPPGTFLGRCADRFGHKTMFISIILRLLSSKLLLAHNDSRWAAALSGKWTNYARRWRPSEWHPLHILAENTQQVKRQLLSYECLASEISFFFTFFALLSCVGNQTLSNKTGCLRPVRMISSGPMFGTPVHECLRLSTLDNTWMSESKQARCQLTNSAPHPPIYCQWQCSTWRFLTAEMTAELSPSSPSLGELLMAHKY